MGMQELSQKHRSGLNLRAAAWVAARQELTSKTHELLSACDLLCPGPNTALTVKELMDQQQQEGSVLRAAILGLLSP